MKQRSQALETAPLREFDLVVIGGGIVGAGIAQDAALRGLSVLLLEKHDFSSGTSSKTTKLIHGGLRYLEQFHFSLTRELCRERERLEQLAPHLVRDFSFVLPLTKQDRFFGIKAQIGLTLYDILARDISPGHRHVKLSQKEVIESAPSLASSLITGGLRFHDCITDDSRLVLEVIKSACQAGALAINYVEVTGFDMEAGRLTAVDCHDRYSGKDFKVRMKSCVNAAGIWTDGLMRLIDKDWKPHVTPAKGIHIMVPQSAFETNTALFLPTKDRRYVFVVPWQRALMIGTTDTTYSGELDNPLPSRDEVDYLLSVVNSYTTSSRLNRSDVVASWAGLRPLVKSGDGKQTGNLSREHVLFDGPGGIVGLIGGKLTNYRIMAVEVVNRVLERNPELGTPSSKASRSARTMLGGFSDKENFLTLTAQVAAKARRLGIEPATLDHLVASYGKDAETIVDFVEAEPGLNQRICPDFPPIMAEVLFSLIHESAVSLEDLLFRRIRLGLVHQKQCLEAAPRVAELVKSQLGWDEARTAIELDALQSVIREHFQSAGIQTDLVSGAA